jgi:hypothetical protein
VAIIFLLILIPGVWCWNMLRAFLPSTAPASFPSTDIVYKAGGSLGFVNADGSDMTTVPLVLGYNDPAGTWQTPLMTGDGSTILVTYTSVAGYQGLVFVIPEGQEPVNCGWYGAIQFTADGFNILINTGTAIEKHKLEDCGMDNLPEKVYAGIIGVLSSDEQYVAEVRESLGEMGREPYIVIRDVETEEERNIGVGDFPAWSPDGQWLAYTGVDGIYIVKNDSNAEPRRLIQIESPEPDFGTPLYQEDRFIEYYPSIASWSPDGQWLVYHVYSPDLVVPDAGAWAGHYAIFKTNIHTGESTRLLDGGYSPSWRWPVEKE